jgi:hypothetical protein
MNLHAALRIVLGLAAILAGAGPARSADDPTPPKGFDAFRLVKARNIFDPDRRGMPSAQAARPAAAPRTNFINLTGTMVADGKMLAFFAGSRSEYSKVISTGDSIADFKVTGITNTHVVLDHAGKQITVPVGQAVPLEGSSAAVAPPDKDAPAPPPEEPGPNGPASNASEATEPKPASSPGGDQNEVLRRMMERRAKELSK